MLFQHFINFLDTFICFSIGNSAVLAPQTHTIDTKHSRVPLLLRLFTQKTCALLRYQTQSAAALLYIYTYYIIMHV